MKLVVQVKLLPTPVQASALATTLQACNAAAEYASRVAFERNVKSRNELQKLCYREIKDRFRLSAQPAVRVVKKVVDAYAALHAGIRAGNLGGERSRRRIKAESKPITFRPSAAQPFDDRCLSWRYDAGTVSIWTTAGRLKGIGFVGSAEQLVTLRPPPGRVGFAVPRWHVVPDRHLRRYRRWHARERVELQAKRTKSANRRLKKRARREARHATCVNHGIAKDIVAVAQRTGRGIALEELRGIRDRVRLYGHQRAIQSSWPFHQLERHITYKARRVGVPVLLVDARYTSQMCPRCKHTTRSNRPTRDTFSCRRCGLAGPADVVAAVNIRDRARRAWVLVNVPMSMAA